LSAELKIVKENQISDEELHVLDAITNLEPISQYELSGFHTLESKLLTTEQLEETISKLSRLGLISIVKTEYQMTISMTPEMKKKAIDMLTEVWQHKKVSNETLETLIEQNYAGALRFLELVTTYEDKSRVTFSDYYFDAEVRSFCQKLWKNHMVFMHTSSSRKHTYESYYLRRIPVNIQNFLQVFILKKFHPEELKLETDWKVLTILLFSEEALKIADIKLNFPNLTQYEVDEILAKLESKGVITIEKEWIKLSKATKGPLKEFFLANRYQAFKAMLIQELKRRVSERSSNLFFLGLVKRILVSPKIRKLPEPFCIVERNLLENIDENDLREAVKLGVIFLTENNVIIAQEVLLELEVILSSTISDRTIIRIPAGDVYKASATLRDIFTKCENYIKIQDEWINEETLQVIQSYSPDGVEIEIISGIERARDADIEEMKRRLYAIRNSGRKIELYFIGCERTGKAPFHYRYIIGKNVCYSISMSIKDIGKSKEADFICIPGEEKEGLIEPAFNYWSRTPKEKLKEIGVVRMNFDEWLKYLSQVT
jgi:hypothetical protein